MKENNGVKAIVQKPWTDEEMGYLYAAREDGIPYKIIASQLGRTLNSCERKFRSTNWSDTKFYDILKCRVKEKFKQAYAKRLAEAQDRKLKFENMKVDIIMDRLSTAISALPNIPKPVYKPTILTKQKHSPEDVGLMFSDCHIGLDYSLEETGGISEYNVGIFEKRMKKLTTALTDIVELHSSLYPLPTLHIFSLGDIVAGLNSVGAWSGTYINLTVWDQLMRGYEAITDAINYWLGLFENIKFYGVMGNHARVAMKGLEKEYVNWDYVCYNHLQLRFRNNDRVKFIIPKSWWIYETIRSHKFLMLHGDDVKPTGNKLSSLATVAEKMAGIIGDVPDYTLAAHYHNAGEWETSYGRVVLNGAFLSGDIYALKNLQLNSRPCQRTFGIHDKRGMTWSYNLYLDNK
jgi:hypothetical protein